MDEGFVGFTFEQAVEPYKRSYGYETSAGRAWTRFDLPFRAADNYAVGEAVMNLRVGYAPQTVEIGGIALTNYGSKVAFESLPATKLTYKGAEPDAPWRREAAARIEKIRKGDLNITVRDAAGKTGRGRRSHRQTDAAEVRLWFGGQRGGAGLGRSRQCQIPGDGEDAVQSRRLRERSEMGQMEGRPRDTATRAEVVARQQYRGARPRFWCGRAGAIRPPN